MKIALVTLRINPALGGAERYTLDLAKSLQARGMDIGIFAAFNDSPPGNSIPIKSPPKVPGMTRVGSYDAFLVWLGEQFADDRPDLVHAMLPVLPGMCDVYHPHAGIAAERSDWLSWWTNPRRRRYAAVERVLLTGDDPPIAITLSQYVEAGLLRHYPDLATDKMFRLFNGVDTERFRPDGPTVPRSEFGARDGEVVGLFVGNDFRRKGLSLAISKLLADGPRHFRLAVAGRDDPKTYLRQAARLGVADRLTFLGPRSDTPALYRSADLFVQLSTHDPCSLATLEALASGLPVLGSRFDGATEMMTAGSHGYVTQRIGADSDCVDGLRSMLAPGRLEQQHAACVSIRGNLSWESHVSRVKELYASACVNNTDATDFS